MNQKVENEFPILADGVYANHAAIAPWPRVASEAVAAFAGEYARTGPTRYKGWIERERDLRSRFARLVGTREARDIAILQNSSEGICAVAFGVPWQSGDNVVIPAGEFPSNRLPWLAQSSRGVEVREIDIRDSDEPENALIEAMDDRTRVLAVSSVQFSDGLRLKMETLGEACASARAIFFVDAIQQLGALPFDVEAARVDCLAAGTHKWMLGPEGLAVFYCREEVRSKLALQRLGWHMYDYPWNFSRNDWTPAASARRFEAGSPNSLGQVAAHASLGLLLEIGMDAVSERILANTGQLTSGLSALSGVSVVSPREQDRQSGIVSFIPGRNEPREVYKRLMKAGVSCALRDDSVRLSPHFYQDEGVIEKLLEYVEEAL